MKSSNEELENEMNRMSGFEEEAKRTKELETRIQELEKEKHQLAMRCDDLEEKERMMKGLDEETLSLKNEKKDLESQLKLLTLRSSTLE